MAVTILIDTNVLLDYFLMRESHYEIVNNSWQNFYKEIGFYALSL